MAEEFKIEEYKPYLRSSLLNQLNAFLPQYITYANNDIDYYKPISEEIIAVFDKDFLNVERENLINNISNIWHKYKIKDKTNIPQEYLDFLERKISSIINDVLYDNPLVHINTELTTRNKNWEKQSEKLKQNVQKSFFQIAKEIRKLKKDEIKHTSSDFINSVKKQLQEIRENFGIEIIITNNITWVEVSQWANNMNKILHNMHEQMEIPYNNLVNNNLITICSNVYSSTSGFFVPKDIREFIHITLDDLTIMSRTWIHEYTHFLDHKAGQIYGKNNKKNDLSYFSEYILFKKVEENDSLSSENIENVRTFLHKSLGVTESNLKDTKEKINILKDKFYINLFEKIGIHYETLPIQVGFLYTDNYQFGNELLSLIYKLEDEDKFIENFVSPQNRECLQLKINILTYINPLNLTPEKAIEMSNVLDSKDFIKNYIKEVQAFFNDNKIIKLNKLGNNVYLETQQNYIIESLKSEKPNYWGSIIEIMARVIEESYTPAIMPPTIPQKKMLDKFRKIGATTVVEKVFSHHDTVKMFYPNKEILNLDFQEKAKKAFNSMFNYIEKDLHLEFQRKNYKKVY